MAEFEVGRLMSVVDVEKVVCRQCYAVLDLADHFCRHCGTAIAAEVDSPQTRPRAGRAGLADNRGVVLFMLFAVLGPLGLPMLWRSSQFSPTWKFLLTVLMLGATAAGVFLIWYSVQSALAPLREFGQFGGL